MPTRSIKLKLIVPRDNCPESIATRQALYLTHQFVNGAAAYYTRLLLEMRQDVVCIGQDAQGQDIIEPADVWRGQLRKRLVDLGLAPATVEEVMPLLRDTYRYIVPVNSSVPAGDGTKLKKQSTHDRAWHGALVDPDSSAQSKNSNPEIVGLAARLRELRALPIIMPYSAGRVVTRGTLCKAERVGLALAAEALSSWDTKSVQCKAEKAELTQRHRGCVEVVSRLCPDALVAIRTYEDARQADIMAAGKARPGRIYRVGERALRCWPEVRRALLACREYTVEARTEIVKAAQRRHRRDFGDQRLMTWLSHPDQRWLVEHAAGDVVSRIARMNMAEIKASHRREFPRFTMPDVRRSPKYMKLGKPGDNNAPSYLITIKKDGLDAGVYVTLNLLEQAEDGLLVERDFKFKLAPQRQLDGLTFAPAGEGNERGLHVSWTRQDQTGRIVGELQGGALLFNRRELMARTPDRLRAGDIGEVWFKLAVDTNGKGVNPELAALYGRRQKVSHWLNAALQNRGKKKGEPPWADFRVLAVDLGIRTAATVSLFAVNPSDTGQTRRLDPRCELTARHERTLALSLPGENPTSAERAARAKLDRKVRALSRKLWRLRVLTRASTATTPDTRLEALADLGDSLSKNKAQEPTAGRWLNRVVQLENLAEHADPASWLDAVRALYREIEYELGLEVGRWRCRGRTGKDREAGGGLSAWHIEYLERCLRFLRGWNNRSRPGQATSPAPRGASDVSDDLRTLREHINHLRDQRVKQTADLIVQAARGLTYRDERWQPTLPGADLIVMEDLSRYQFKADRAPFENSQLMSWSHRGIRLAVGMQAEVEGIVVSDVGAGYTSRFDPLTSAPGMRCHAVTADDVADLARNPKHWLRRHIATRLKRHGFDPDQLRPGDLVPNDGGKVLVTLRGEKIHAVNADVCAAQNLARRYLEGYATPVRVYGQVLTIADRRCVYLDLETNGQRLQGALGGKHVLFVEDDDGYWTPTTYPTARAAKTALLGSAPVLDVGADEEEETDEVSAFGGGRLGLFRDPSGALFGGCWVDSRRFWPAVEAAVAAKLVAKKIAQGVRLPDRGATYPLSSEHAAPAGP